MGIVCANYQSMATSAPGVVFDSRRVADDTMMVVQMERDFIFFHNCVLISL